MGRKGKIKPGGPRRDLCPACGTQLRYEKPDSWGMACGAFICPRCKYKRPEGSARNRGVFW